MVLAQVGGARTYLGDLLNDVRTVDRPDLGPSFLDSLVGFLRPGRETAREGAAGAAFIAGAAAGCAAALLVVFRRRQHEAR